MDLLSLLEERTTRERREAFNLLTTFHGDGDSDNDSLSAMDTSHESDVIDTSTNTAMVPSQHSSAVIDLTATNTASHSATVPSQHSAVIDLTATVPSQHSSDASHTHSAMDISHDPTDTDSIHSTITATAHPFKLSDYLACNFIQIIHEIQDDIQNHRPLALRNRLQGPFHSLFKGSKEKGYTPFSMPKKLPYPDSFIWGANDFIWQSYYNWTQPNNKLTENNRVEKNKFIRKYGEFAYQLEYEYKVWLFKRYWQIQNFYDCFMDLTNEPGFIYKWSLRTALAFTNDPTIQLLEDGLENGTITKEHILASIAEMVLEFAWIPDPREYSKIGAFTKRPDKKERFLEAFSN
jgi:hypothetical protein